MSTSRSRNRDAAALRRAAWVYALRDGWTESERHDLSEAVELVEEILAAYDGRIDDDLLSIYGHELEEHDGTT